MTAEAGPGPSSMAGSSSPIVPASAKKLRVKKRMINIVNPAGSFSNDHESLENSHEEERRSRETTPLADIGNVMPSGNGTPLGEFAKRGILRPSGTPGSGNGVRFFPKNRFRVITPNNSMSQHPASPASKALAASTATPERRKQSLLTQLLAVAMPSVSPERPPPVVKPDESWEQPGQEGEISLVASSVASGFGEDEEYDVDQSLHHEIEEADDSWNGTPFIISSPLNLPEGDSRDISAHELNPQDIEGGEVVKENDESTEWNIQVPDDMSNLMNEKWSPTDPSFSMSDPPPRHTPPYMPMPTRNLALRTFERSPSASLVEGNSTDIMATVRKRVSPTRINSPGLLAPVTPTPAVKPIGSIFAEMSAEQADMSWPLLGDDGGSPLRSTIFGQDASPLNLPPMSLQAEKQATPQSSDKTQFFDCTTSSFDFSPLQSRSVVSKPATSTTLMQPTQTLFEAQSEHTKALVKEVNLYRDLASRLHAEVMERDGVLADLNGRVLDTEVLRSQVGDLKEEVEKLRAASTSPRGVSREMSASPLAARSAHAHPHAHAGDRTTIVQAETRDLEIRFAKALAEQEMLQKEMNEIRHESETKDQELETTRQALSELEDRHRDHLISSRQSPPPTDTRELDEALERCADLEFELTRATDLAQDLTGQVEDMRQVKASDEEEIDRLNVAVEGLRDSKRSEDGMKLRLEEMERRIDAEMRRREEMEDHVREERDARKRLEVENRELVKSIQATRLQLAHSHTPSPDAGLSAEISRLRAESASKDMEIVTLQRRKNELKEDREMLNIALDSKQQELELIKRKFAVKGVAGATPLGHSTKTNTDADKTPMLYANTPAPGKSRRRSSMNNQFITPSVVNGDKRALRSSAMLSSLAVPRGGVENTPAPPGRYGSLRRERVPA